MCGFNFEEVYGERRKDFIGVHHVKPLSTLEEEVVINPEQYLVPVCAKCHRMMYFISAKEISQNQEKKSL
ncbi:hypothetical protein [Priestia aryabhattai]|uniref:hypothetical protein n=1 Tax=Priestia aryabhattai TaxID=412384 RepID=UPI00355802AA